MAELVLNTDSGMVYAKPQRVLKPYEKVLTCPQCGSTAIGDYGEKFRPRYACANLECGQMFDLEEATAQK